MVITSKHADKQTEAWISDLVGAICDPIIVWPSGWNDTLPEWLPGQIKMERLIMLMDHHKNGAKLTGTNAEALAYMYARTLEATLDSDWTEIYLYLGTKVIPFGRNIQVEDYPEDIKRETLTDYQMGKLNHLKDFIYEQKIKARKGKEASRRREEKESKVREQARLQPSMFEM